MIFDFSGKGVPVARIDGGVGLFGSLVGCGHSQEGRDLIDGVACDGFSGAAR